MKFDLEHWVPLFFLCVVNKPPHEHDLCRWPRLDPLIVGVCAGVRASVCAGQVGAFSQLDARRPSPNPNPRPSQSQLPAITIQVRSRSQSYRYSSTHLRTLTARSPLGTPQNTCHNPTEAPLKPHPIRHVRYTIYHTHIASTCAFCPPSGNRQTAIPNTQYPIPIPKPNATPNQCSLWRLLPKKVLWSAAIVPKMGLQLEFAFSQATYSNVWGPGSASQILL